MKLCQEIADFVITLSFENGADNVKTSIVIDYTQHVFVKKIIKDIRSGLCLDCARFSDS